MSAETSRAGGCFSGRVEGRLPRLMKEQGTSCRIARGRSSRACSTLRSSILGNAAEFLASQRGVNR